MKKVCIGLACIFGVLAVVFYFSSINKLDSATARALGTSATINIQGTVFCAAFAIMCIVCIVGAMILHQLEFVGTSSSSIEPEFAKKTKDFKMASTQANREVDATTGWKCKHCGTYNEKGMVCKKCSHYNSD